MEDDVDKAKQMVEPLNAVDKAIENIGFGRYQTFMMWVNIIAVAEQNLVINILPALQGSDINQEFLLTDAEWGAVASGVQIGGGIGLILFGFVFDLYGRYKPFLASLILTITFGALQLSAINYVSLIITQTLMQVASAGLLASVPTGFLEVLPPNRRGYYTQLLFLLLPIGAFLSAVLGWIVIGPNPFGFDARWSKWRVLVFIELFPLIPTAILYWIYGLPSPYYLFKNNQPEKAHDTLRKIAEFNGLVANDVVPPLHEFFPSRDARVTEVSNLLDSHEDPPAIELPSDETDEENSICGILKQIVDDGQSLWIMVMFIFVQLGDSTWQLMVGVQLEAARIPYFQTLIIGNLVGVVPIILVSFYVDQSGRLRCIRALCFFNIVSFLIATVDTSRALFVPIYVVLTGLSFALMSITQLYTAEVLPTRIRASGFGVAYAAQQFLTAPAVAGAGYALSLKEYPYSFPLAMLILSMVSNTVVFVPTRETAGRYLR